MLKVQNSSETERVAVRKAELGPDAKSTEPVNPAVGTCYEPEGTAEWRRRYWREVYLACPGSLPSRNKSKQRRRFYGMVPKRGDYLHSLSFLGWNVRETPLRSTECPFFNARNHIVLQRYLAEGRGACASGADPAAFVRKVPALVITPDTANYHLKEFLDDFVRLSRRTVYVWVLFNRCPDIPRFCRRCSSALDRLVAARADCLEGRKRAVPFVWPTKRYDFAANWDCLAKGILPRHEVPYVWPETKPYVFAGSEAPKDTTSKFDNQLIPAWITDPGIRDLYWYAVTQARRRKLVDLEEAISMANEAVIDAWLTYSPECCGGASCTEWLKQTVRNAIDAWSKRKENRPKRGPDYEANQQLNGFVPPSDQRDCDGSALHYHEHEARPRHICGDPLFRLPRRSGKKPWRDRLITLDCTECKQPCLTFQGANPDRYTCDTCLAGLNISTLWYDLECKVEDALEALGWSQKDYAKHLETRYRVETTRHVLYRDRNRQIPTPYYEDTDRHWQTPGWTPDLERSDEGPNPMDVWDTVPPAVRERIKAERNEGFLGEISDLLS
jgi:hypothetical protein